MTRCLSRTTPHKSRFLHSMGSLEPEMRPTDTGRYVCSTSRCCSQRATVGAKNQTTCRSRQESRAKKKGERGRRTLLGSLSSSCLILNTAMSVFPDPVSRAMMMLRCKDSSSISCWYPRVTGKSIRSTSRSLSLRFLRVYAGIGAGSDMASARWMVKADNKCWARHKPRMKGPLIGMILGACQWHFFHHDKVRWVDVGRRAVLFKVFTCFA